ncbi:hypothetical protein MTR_4g103590 [Medicago truncatula]|uniref:Uncharacterized protein n=1 Tax=Medicago truncatula TaxID=3880 RepID=G7JLF0_MEDTR|nr:hypothetical protein MTR_4g103590 [Medicago truncatula]
MEHDNQEHWSNQRQLAYTLWCFGLGSLDKDLNNLVFFRETELCSHATSKVINMAYQIEKEAVFLLHLTKRIHLDTILNV